MERIESQHLRNILKLTCRANDDLASRCYSLSRVLLEHFLGREWCEQVLRPDHLNVMNTYRDSRVFLRTDCADFRHIERVVRLTNLLLNMQDVLGIQGCLSRIQSGVLEATYAELEFAGHFHRRGIPVQFRSPIGIRGKDYDLDVGIGLATLACEVKCKLEETELGETTIINALKHASKQVPPDGTSILGVKFPEQWIRDPKSRPLLNAALSTFFRNSRRVAAVVLRWEEVVIGESYGAMVLYRFLPFLNPSPRALNVEMTLILDKLTTEFDSTWATDIRAYAMGV